MEYLDITTGKPYAGSLPTDVVLPVHRDDPIPHSIEVTSKVGDDDWDESLERWMWFQGYARERGAA